MPFRLLLMMTVAVGLMFQAAPVRAAVVLQYHHVSDRTPASTSTSPERFAAHLDAIEQGNFRVVSLESLVRTLREGRELANDAVAITFDDGYRSIYDTAYPLLRERGYPFTVFVNSEPHDQGRPLYMSWDELRKMSRNGATIANHTVSHPSLITLGEPGDEAGRQAALTREIDRAQRRIGQEIGSAPLLLAYPFGEFDGGVRAWVAERGYTAFGQNSGPLGRHDDLQALPRFPFGGPFGDADDFRVKLNSLPMPLAEGGRGVGWADADGNALDDMVLPGPRVRPILILEFRQGVIPPRISCFASGQGSIEVKQEGFRAEIQASAPMGPGRFRYNCTAPSGQKGRFHWFSQQWIVRDGY